MNARTPEPPAHTRHQASYAWLVLLLLVVTRTDGAADIAERWRAAECQLFFDREPACAQLHAAFDRCEQDANASRPARFRRQTCTREDLGAGGRGSAVDWGSGGLAATEIVVSAEFKFVYVVNRKAASSTVTNILKHVFGATAATSCRDGSEHIRKHGDRCVTTTVTEKMLDEYYFFTFVRDPVARFYSGIVQAFDGAMQFGAEHCREEMLDILDYIRETSRVPDVHLESQAHALSSPVYVRGLAGAIDFDFIGSADGVAEAFLVLFDKIEAHAGKKLTRRHRQLAFRLSLEKHNAAGSKSPEAARLVEMVTECRSRHRSSIDPEVRAVYQQDLVCGFDMAPTFADAVLTPATNEHVLHGDDHPAISLRLARDSLALLVDSNGALGVKLSVNVQGCVKGRPYLLRAFLKPLGSTHVHFWQQSFLGAKSVDVTRSFANVQRASRHRVVLSLDDLHPTHAVTEGGQADSLLARLDVTHELRAPDPAYTKPGLEEPARFSFAQLHGSSLIAWRQRETLITRRHRPFVAIVEPANNAVLLRECEGGYSSGHMIVRLDFSVGSLSELDMHQAPAEGGNYSVFIDGTLIASDVLFRKCPSNVSMHKTLGYTRNGQMLCDERVNPAGTLSPLSIRKISVSMDKMNCASQHVVAVKYLVTDPISEVITRWSHFSIAPVPQTGLGQGAVLFDPPVTWLSSNFSTCAANVIVYETYSQVCQNGVLSTGYRVVDSYAGLAEDYEVLHCVLRRHAPDIGVLLEIGTDDGIGLLVADAAMNGSAREGKWGLLTLDLPVCVERSAACAHAAGSEKTQDIGLAARQEKLPFTQFWGSSLTFDFDALGPIDVFWIHGAHDYTLVRHQTRAAIRAGASLILLHDADVDVVEVLKGALDALIEFSSQSSSHTHRTPDTSRASLSYCLHYVYDTRIAYAVRVLNTSEEARGLLPGSAESCRRSR